MTTATAQSSDIEVRQIQVTFDCADPGRLATFWCAVLGYRIDPPPAGYASWTEALTDWGVPESEHNSRSAAGPGDGGTGPRLFFQRVPEGKVVKNRLHLDVRAAPGLTGDERMTALQAECDRLQQHGASFAYRCDPDEHGENGFICLLDPEGNEFCLD